MNAFIILPGCKYIIRDQFIYLPVTQRFIYRSAVYPCIMNACQVLLYFAFVNICRTGNYIPPCIHTALVYQHIYVLTVILLSCYVYNNTGIYIPLCTEVCIESSGVYIQYI